MDTMNDDTDLEQEIPGMTTAQARNLYTSHFLSTWNVRTYEFAAVSFGLCCGLGKGEREEGDCGLVTDGSA